MARRIHKRLASCRLGLEIRRVLKSIKKIRDVYDGDGYVVIDRYSTSKHTDMLRVLGDSMKKMLDELNELLKDHQGQLVTTEWVDATETAGNN